MAVMWIKVGIEVPDEYRYKLNGELIDDIQGALHGIMECGDCEYCVTTGIPEIIPKTDGLPSIDSY